MEAELKAKVTAAKILVVGAGGIGCELLKNLVLCGFDFVDVIDLDTIDVSNLNRQFLFQKKHIGKPKAQVAAETVKSFRPAANVTAHHANIQNSEFDVNFFKQYSLVLNALDNRAARNHVNRMCLAADVTLVESGSSGYLGQVSVIKKGWSECYECLPKPAQRTYPGCTIRNTPSEPIHCIVWAKHLFNQLFGEADIDEDVSPDAADPELAAAVAAATAQNGIGEAQVGGESAEVNGKGAAETTNGKAAAAEEEAEGGTQRVSTRKWADDNAYDPRTLFTKLFGADIDYLLSMGALWKKRRAPVPLSWDDLPDENPQTSGYVTPALRDQTVWSPAECRKVFDETVKALHASLQTKEEGSVLVWDKDDERSVDFVAACANLRSHIFGIPLKSRFDIKSMAGNIIPAIATTNAIVAGMIVLEALKILNDQMDKCKTVFFRRLPNPRGKILVDDQPYAPNPKCYVCSDKPEVRVVVNTASFTVKCLEEKVLKAALNMVAPDVSLADGSGTILVSSEQGETDALADKPLSEVGVHDGSILTCDDFMQQFELRLVVVHSDETSQMPGEFQVVTDISDLKAQPLPEKNDHASAASDDEIEELPQEMDVSPKKAAKRTAAAAADEPPGKKAKA